MKLLYVVGLPAALLLGGCAAPRLTEMTLQHGAAGNPMLTTATFRTRACIWRAPSSVRIRRSGSTDWKTLPAPTMISGEIWLWRRSTWETTVPGSESFRDGESYDIQWTVPYNGSAPLYGCPPDKAPRSMMYLRTFAVPRQ